MSVIAKLRLEHIREFGHGALYEMGCVCENDLMANYAGSEENRLFTKASPWGDARFHLNISAEFPQAMQGDEFYAIMVRKDEPGYCERPSGAFLMCPARVASMTDFGGTSKQVEITSAYNVPKELTLQRFSWKMSIDNPGASDQLKPGSDEWVLSLYCANGNTRDTVIAAAHALRSEKG